MYNPEKKEICQDNQCAFFDMRYPGNCERIRPDLCAMPDHEENEGCWCSPEVQEHQGGTLIIHNEEN